MQTELSQFTALIGIDWADKKHDVCVQATASGKRQSYQVPHKAEKLDEWARSLHRQYDGPIAIALELTKGPIVSALQKYDFFVIFPIDPTTLANYRRTFTPSGAKDDPTDAEYALNLLLTHTEHFTALRPQSVEMRTLMTPGRAATSADERPSAAHQPLAQCVETVLSTGFRVVRPYRYAAVL